MSYPSVTFQTSGSYRESVRAWLRVMNNDLLADWLAWAADEEPDVARLLCIEAAERLRAADDCR